MDITKSTQPYEKPKTQVVGTVTELTEGKRTGSALDKGFPVGTTVPQLTFS